MSPREPNALLPPPPAGVPPGFTEPSRAYKRNAWLAVGGLLGFVALYLGLTGYLGWVVYRLLAGAARGGGNVGAAVVLSLPALFFFAFLVRGLFVVKRMRDPQLIELSPSDEPRLFHFLHELADATGAPRPHKVFLSARVNAGVFYDLSFRNLLLPTKKNLEIGLGVVNVLSLDELKAVVAHEFGHFAQRSMAIGRWVYIAQQVAGHIVVSRGIFDRFLSGLSLVDLRVAWIGWILRVFVWAIRATLDSAFRVVVLAERALGREMEFAADRAAVAVSGSDSLVHALHLLGPADEAWDSAASFAASERAAGRDVEDLFALQSAALDEVRRILDDPSHGRTPGRPANAARHRVFSAELAQPPRMWLTHPPNREREDHAKSPYLASALDPRPAWALFTDPALVRRRATERLFAEAPRGKEKEPVEGSALERFVATYRRRALDPRYLGVYLGRLIASFDDRAATLTEAVAQRGRAALLGALDALYPSTLKAEVSAYRERREEEGMLEGLQDGVLTAPGGLVRYRGREVPRREVPALLEAVRAERRAVEQRILAHDRRCRGVHLAIAEELGAGWPEHHQGLVHLLHFATHAGREVIDAHGVLHHVLDIALADGRVSSSERRQVLWAAEELHTVLEGAWARWAEVKLPQDLAAKVEAEGGVPSLAQRFELGPPSEAQLGEWLGVIDGWALGAFGDLKSLAQLTLERLLEVEDLLAGALRGEQPLEGAPEPARVPQRYPVRVIGGERPRQKKLGWWDRFQTADGFIPGALRATVAAGLLGPALFMGGTVGSATVYVLNGLAAPVRVQLGETTTAISPLSFKVLELPPSQQLRIHTETLEGTAVEDFEAELGGGFSKALYNVAGATTLVEHTVVYGGNGTAPDRRFGAQRWLLTPQDDILRDPPRTMSLKKGEVSHRRVLEAAMAAPPNVQLDLAASEEERQSIARVHARFDAPDSELFLDWLGALPPEQDLAALLEPRRAEAPVLVERALQDHAKPEDREARCRAVLARAEAAPKDPDLRYLATRCLPSGPAQNAAFLAAHAAHPQHPWLCFAAADDLAAAGRIEEALQAWLTVLGASPTRPLAEEARAGYLRTYRLALAQGSQRKRDAIVGAAPEWSVVRFLDRLAAPGLPDDAPAVSAFRALDRGELAQALQSVRGEPVDVQGRILLLVAASDGAPPELIAPALQLGRESLSGDAALHWAALAVREVRASRADAATLRTRAEAAGLLEDFDRFQRWAGPEGLREIEEARAGLGLGERAGRAALGLVLHGERAPKAWRDEARAVLFPFERPYFRAAEDVEQKAGPARRRRAQSDSQ